jgi:chaperone modulatory protein CbpM
MAKKAFQKVMLVDAPLSLVEVCQVINIAPEVLVEFVEFGIVEPIRGHSAKNWQFSAMTLRRARTALHLQKDLHLDLRGLALTLDLLEEVNELRQRIDFFESHFKWED